MSARAGASISHGHAQLTVSESPYPRIERLAECASDYASRPGPSRDYFDDMFLAHKSVGLGLESKNARIMAYLTPVKDNEVVILTDDAGASLKHAIYMVLESLYCNRDRGFNISMVPFFLFRNGGSPVRRGPLPVITRIVDRGPLNQRTSDIGAMELYSASVISSDPFTLFRRLKPGMA